MVLEYRISSSIDLHAITVYVKFILGIRRQKTNLKRIKNMRKKPYPKHSLEIKILNKKKLNYLFFSTAFHIDF